MKLSLFSRSVCQTAFVAVIGGMAAVSYCGAGFAAGDVQPVSMTAGEPVSNIAVTARAAPPDAEGRYLYIVRFPEPSLAAYRGGVDGLVPTSPRASGQRRLDTRSAAATAYRDHLRSRHADYLARMGATLGRNVDARNQYFNVLNAAAVWLTPDEARRVLSLDFVRSMHIDEVDKLLTDAGPEWVGAPAFWDGETTSGGANRGEGMILGIMDSGVMHTHESFAELASDGYQHTNPYGSGNFVGVCGTHPDAQCNDKLIGSYMLHHLATTPEGTGSHGTHVAGTAGGNPNTTTLSGHPVELSGVAPRANVINYKVCDFHPDEGQVLCTSAARTEAVELALDDGVDVLNHSIGDSINPWISAVSLAFLDAHEAGIYVAAAAGNAGPNPATLAGSLGPWNATLANSSHHRAIGHVVEAAELTGLVGVPGSGPTITTDVTADVLDAAVVNPGNGLGCSPFPSNTFDGAIALISRGDCAFADKVNNATNAGAVGVIVFNNLGGPAIVMGGLEGTTTPAVMVDNADGTAVQAALAGGADPEGTIFAATTLTYKAGWGGLTANGSSRGPNTVVDILKPDVSAPGTNILAAVAGGAYNTIGGTSMASPHNAGAAALIMAEHPDWTPAEVMSAIALTAIPDNMFKQDGSPADPFDYGSGRLNLAAAARIGFVMDESIENFEDANPALGGDPRTLNLPSMQNSECFGGCAWQRTITSVLPTAVDYSATVVSPTGLVLDVDPPFFTLGAGQSLTLNITADTSTLPHNEWFFGEVVIEPSVVAGGTQPQGTGVPVARMPVVVQSVVPLPEIDVDPTEIALALPLDDTTSVPLTVTNLGEPGSELVYSIEQAQPASVVLESSAADEHVVQGGGPSQPVSLIVDTGISLLGGVGPNQQALWFNQFTPRMVDLPFTLEQVDVAWAPNNGGVVVGDQYDVYVWSAPDRDPNGQLDLLAAVTGVAVTAGVDFKTVNLPGGVPITADTGDVLIGIVNRVLADPYAPMISDAGPSNQRSWVAFDFPGGMAGDPPDLSQAGTLTLIDDIGTPRNWSIRGRGTGGSVCLTPSDVPWLSVSPDSGVLGGGDSDQIMVEINTSGLSAGTYEARLCVESNDQREPVFVVPVWLQAGVDGIFQDRFEDN